MTDILIHRQDTSGVVSCRPGDTLVLELEENLSTGYSWALTTQPAFCRLVDSQHTPARSGLMGAPGTRRLRISVTEAGSGSLELSFRRNWDPSEGEADHVSVRIHAGRLL